MTLTSVFSDSAKIIGEFILDILYFPLWWYTRGFFKVLVWAERFLGARFRGSALGVWLRNLFTPMYGQHDWAGMLISFIVRCFQIFFRTLMMIFWLAYVVVAIALWLVAPVFIVSQIIFQISA